MELCVPSKFAAGVPRRTDPQVGLARAIRKIRADASLSQRDLAQKVELDPSQMSRLEHGDANPTWGTVRRIAVALEVTLGELAELAEDFEERLRSEDADGSR
jgi:transcriptional regulator with XRE-family HTH domain